MGISAELLVEDKTIVFDEFKATETISHVEDVFVSRISSEYGEPYSLMVWRYIYICMNGMYVKSSDNTPLDAWGNTVTVELLL